MAPKVLQGFPALILGRQCALRLQETAENYRKVRAFGAKPLIKNDLDAA